MAQTTGNRQTERTGRGEYRRNPGNRNITYIGGSAARKLDVVTEIHRPRRPELSNAVRKNRDKAVYMNLGYVVFLAVSIIVSGWILVGYIRLHSEITASIKRIASMESTLNSMRVANDEEITRIESAVDLDEIRRIAITELGMTYPDEGQIVSVPDSGSDYVRQIGEPLE